MEHLLPELARIAQAVYNEWTVNDGYGRCIQIAVRWCAFLNDRGFCAQLEGLDQEHTTVNVKVKGKWINIDLPAGYYEHVYAGRWVKFPDVKIDPEWIEIASAALPVTIQPHCRICP